MCRALYRQVDFANVKITTFSAKVYISETKRRVDTRLKEHKDACIKGFTDKSAIAEHALTEDHPIREGSNLHMNGTRELALQLRRWLYRTRKSEVEPARAVPTRQHCRSDSQCACPSLAFNNSVNRQAST